MTAPALYDPKAPLTHAIEEARVALRDWRHQRRTMFRMGIKPQWMVSARIAFLEKRIRFLKLALRKNFGSGEE